LAAGCGPLLEIADLLGLCLPTALSLRPLLLAARRVVF
jgi:hypothetical protein